MSSLSPLLNNLDAEDLAVRLYTILRLQELTGSEVIPEKLRQAAETEPDPALKLYLSWLAYPEKASNDTDLASLSDLLSQKQPDWTRALRLLLQTKKESAAPVLAVLRKASLSNLPPGLLPILVGFYSRFGDSQDLGLFEEWCSHPNPAVTILAVEGLSRIQPDKLKSFLYPLLTSESAGIRSRAIRLLYRWHPQEAISQLSDMLASDIIDERRAALAHAFFLPFDRIKNDLIRFMIKEVEPALLVQAGQLLIINPDLEVAKAIAVVAIETTSEKAPIITNILTQQCEFIARINLIIDKPGEFANGLLEAARLANDERRLGSLTETIQSGLLQQQTAADLAQSAAWLKKKFSLNLPQPTLLAVVESLAVIEPEFLMPYLPGLLQMRDIKLQIAGLSAMARVMPARAEKLLEQYLCSATPTRRRTGINVLSRLDKAFTLPLLLKTLALETEKELLELIKTQLTEPLPRENLVQLLKDSQNAEASPERQSLISSLCEQAGLKSCEISPTATIRSGFSNEEIMLGRAEKQGLVIEQSQLQKARETAQPAAKKTQTAPKLYAQYSGNPPAAKVSLIIDLIAKNACETDELTNLLQGETAEMQIFAIQAALKAIGLRSQKSFSPVKTLKRNLAQDLPIWDEVAAVLAMMSAQSARLTAPMFQQLPWTCWPETIMPFMLNFISITAKPQFSIPVSRLLRHSRPEIRCSAISCLLAINPGELAESLPSLQHDEDPEVAALAKTTARNIAAQAYCSGSHSLGAILLHNLQSLANRWQQLPMTAQIGVPVFIMLSMGFYLFIAEPPSTTETGAASTALASHADAGHKVSGHRFDYWLQPASPGQERVVFGRIEENYSDSILIQSPVLLSPVLIRHKMGVLPLQKNQHFSARVKVDTVVGSRIESTLLPKTEDKK